MKSEQQKAYTRQKSALTRAINSGDPAKIRSACKAAVTEWNAWGTGWPDDWSRWQRALDDSLPWHSSVRLEDL
jgi:hypothetical protein